MFGLDTCFGASAIKALKPGMTECLDHTVLYPDRIQDSMMQASSDFGSLTNDGRVQQSEKAPGPFRHLSQSIVPKRNVLAVNPTVS
jgi:hypothetical protein